MVDEELLERLLDGRLPDPKVDDVARRIRTERRFRQHFVDMLLFRNMLATPAPAGRQRECEAVRRTFLLGMPPSPAVLPNGMTADPGVVEHLHHCRVCALAREAIDREAPREAIAPIPKARRTSAPSMRAAAALLLAALLVGGTWVAVGWKADPAASIRENPQFARTVAAIDELGRTHDSLERQKLYTRLNELEEHLPEAVMWRLVDQEDDAENRALIYILSLPRDIRDGDRILQAIRRERRSGGQRNNPYLAGLLPRLKPANGAPLVLELLSEAARQGGTQLAKAGYATVASMAYGDDPEVVHALEDLSDHGVDEGCRAIARMEMVRRAVDRGDTPERVRWLERCIEFLDSTDDLARARAELVVKRYGDPVYLRDIEARLAATNPTLLKRLEEAAKPGSTSDRRSE